MVEACEELPNMGATPAADVSTTAWLKVGTPASFDITLSDTDMGSKLLFAETRDVELLVSSALLEMAEIDEV
jgi:hypothetical protein